MKLIALASTDVSLAATKDTLVEMLVAEGLATGEASELRKELEGGLGSGVDEDGFEWSYEETSRPSSAASLHGGRGASNTS